MTTFEDFMLAADAYRAGNSWQWQNCEGAWIDGTEHPLKLERRGLSYGYRVKPCTGCQQPSDAECNGFCRDCWDKSRAVCARCGGRGTVRTFDDDPLYECPDCRPEDNSPPETKALTALDWIIGGPWWVCTNPSAPNLFANMVIHASDSAIVTSTNGCQPVLSHIRHEDYHHFQRTNGTCVDGKLVWEPCHKTV